MTSEKLEFFGIFRVRLPVDAHLALWNKKRAAKNISSPRWDELVCGSNQPVRFGEAERRIPCEKLTGKMFSRNQSKLRRASGRGTPFAYRPATIL